MQLVRVQREPSATVVSASGELDAFTAPELAEALDQADGDAVVVDLAGVAFMDSTALGALVRGVKGLKDRGARTRVVLPATSAKRIFEITTLDRVLPVSASRADAVRELAARDSRA
jgi:anti-sigma B factor antagonist